MDSILFYVLSAYTLTVLCIFFWRKFPWLKYHYNQDPLIQKVLKDDRAFSISMHAEQCINFCYGGCKNLTGIVIGSAWVGGEGIYNFSQGCIQLYQFYGIKRCPVLHSSGKLTGQLDV